MGGSASLLAFFKLSSICMRGNASVKRHGSAIHAAQQIAAIRFACPAIFLPASAESGEYTGACKLEPGSFVLLKTPSLSIKQHSNSLTDDHVCILMEFAHWRSKVQVILIQRRGTDQRSKSAAQVPNDQRRERTSFLISRSIFLRSFCSRMLWSTSSLRMWSMGSLARLTPWTSSLVR